MTKIHTFNLLNVEEEIILEGKPIESFERISKIKEIILLGQDGAVRRIILSNLRPKLSRENRQYLEDLEETKRRFIK